MFSLSLDHWVSYRCRNLLLLAALLSTIFVRAEAAETLVLRHERSGGSFLWGIAKGEGRLIAVGEEGTVLTSIDGKDWQRVESGTTDALMAVTYGGGRFVAVGANGTVLISDHGTEWVRTRTSGTTERLNNVAWSQGLYVAVGEHGVILTSTDAEVWTLRLSGGTGWLRALYASPGEGYTSTWTLGGLVVTVFYPRFLAGGEDGKVLASMDGINWGLSNAPFSSSWYSSGPDVEALTLSSQGYVEVGSDGLVTSTEVFGGGTAAPNWLPYTWSPVPENVRLRGIVECGQEVYVFGERGTVLKTSGSFAPWTPIASHTPASLSAGVSLGNSFYLVGENETILQLETTDATRLVNLSSRGMAGRDDATLISGFVVQGAQPKRVLLRAVGPGLTTLAGLSGVVATPQITLLDAAHHEIAKNAGWMNASDPDRIQRTAAQVGAFPLATVDRDAALLVTLDPGLYTALVSPQNGASGLCLVEVYDADDTDSTGSRAINISTRAHVGLGDDLLIAGFVVSGESARALLIRGAGPALKARFGMSGVLEQPQLKLVNSGGSVMATVNAWSSSPHADVIRDAAKRVGAFDFDEGSKDSAMLVTLSPGVYTVLVTGADGGSGTALVEVYDLP